MMSYLRVLSFNAATGIMLFANKNEIPAISIDTKNSGCIKRSKGMPADLIATNSKLSPRLPKVIIDDNSKASGKASGTQLIATRPVKWANVPMSNPLPTRSSIYNQKNCITSTNSAMKKVAKKGPIKDFIINVSSFLITLHKVYNALGQKQI